MKSVNTYLAKLFNPYFWFVWFAVGLWAWIFELDKIFSSIAILSAVPALFLLHKLHKELSQKLKDGK